MRDDMDRQFASKASTSINSFEPNFKIYDASFQAYRFDDDNEDRTAVMKTDYGCIVGVFDGMKSNSFGNNNLLKYENTNDGFRSLR